MVLIKLKENIILTPFSLVIKPINAHIIFSFTLSQGWTIRQFDVHNAFLNSHLEETVYMRQLPKYVHVSRPSYVCKLHHSLYGLKQTP